MDYHTLFIVLISALLVQAVALYQSWQLNREEVGIRDWALAAVFMSVASLVHAIRITNYPAGSVLEMAIPAKVIGGLGNTLLIASWFLVWIGIQHFYRARAFSYRRATLFTLVLGIIMMLETVIELQPGWRIFWVSAAVSLFSTLTLFELYKRADTRNYIIGILMLIFVATSVIWLVRALVNLDISILGIDSNTIATWSLYNGIMGSFAFTVSMILLINERINVQLRLQATHDPLTDALNRRAFFESAKPILGDLKRNEISIGLCLIDLDNFKHINDDHGHATGDMVLRRFADIAHANLRDGDLFARYGGEEFVMLLRDSNDEKARQVLSRLRELFSQEFRYGGETVLRPTFSVGVCQVNGPSQVDIDNLLDKADSALYRAKDRGRDRVEFVTAPA